MNGEEIVERDRRRGDVPALQGRPTRVQINEALGIDRKTFRMYLAQALAEGLAPCPQVFD